LEKAERKEIMLKFMEDPQHTVLQTTIHPCNCNGKCNTRHKRPQEFNVNALIILTIQLKLLLSGTDSSM
jgi:hypothetical protein